MVILRHGNPQWLCPGLFEDECGVMNGKAQEANINVAFMERLHLGFGAHVLQFDVYRRVFLSQKA